MRRTSKFSILAVVVVLLATACGSSGSSKAEPSATTTTTLKVDKVADEKLIEGAVLTATDAPDGFVVAEDSSESSDPPEQTKRDFANCLKTDFTIFDDDGNTASADGVNFETASAQITNGINMHETIADIDVAYETMTKAGAEECIAELFNTVFKAQADDGTEFGDVVVGRFTVEDVGDRSVGYRASVPVTVASGESGTVYFDLLLVQRGRAAITLTSLETDATPDRDTEVELAQKMVERLGATAP